MYITLSQSLSALYISSFIIFRLAFPTTRICALEEYVLLLPQFSMESLSWLPVPTLTYEQKVEAAEVTFVYPSTKMFAFDRAAHTENDILLF